MNTDSLSSPKSLVPIFLLIVLVASFTGLGLAVLGNDLITEVDMNLAQYLYDIRTPGGVSFFVAISYLGIPFVVTMITLLCSTILLLYNRKYELIGLLCSVGVSSLIAVSTKFAVGRPRPELAVFQEVGYSFPSFHATISLGLYGFLFLLVTLHTRSFLAKIFWVFLAVMMAFLIGFSRIYLDVHYLSDVLGGWILGALGIVVGYMSMKMVPKNHIPSQTYQNSRNVYVFGLIAIPIMILVWHYPNYSSHIFSEIYTQSPLQK